MRADYIKSKIGEIQQKFNTIQDSIEISIKELESSHVQVSILSVSLNTFIRSAVEEINELSSRGDDQKALEMSLDSLNKIGIYLNNEPARIVSELSKLNFSLDLLHDFDHAQTELKAQIQSKEDSLEKIKSELEDGKDPSKRTGAGKRPERIKDVREAKAELAVEKKAGRKSRKKSIVKDDDKS